MAKGQVPANAYSESDRKAALELAAVVGMKPAARQLGIDRSQLYRWVDMYPQYWSDLRAGQPEAHRKGIAQRLEDLAERYGEAEHDALDRAEELLGTADPKELAALIKAMGSSRQAATLGARTVLGEATSVTDVHIDFPQIEQAMEALLNQGAPQPALQVPNEAEVVEVEA